MNSTPEPAVAVGVFQLGFQFFSSRTNRIKNIFSRAESLQEPKDVVVHPCFHLRCLCCLNPWGSSTFPGADNEGFHWQLKLLQPSLGISWEHHPVKAGLFHGIPNGKMAMEEFSISPQWKLDSFPWNSQWWDGHGGVFPLSHPSFPRFPPHSSITALNPWGLASPWERCGDPGTLLWSRAVPGDVWDALEGDPSASSHWSQRFFPLIPLAGAGRGTGSGRWLAQRMGDFKEPPWNLHFQALTAKVFRRGWKWLLLNLMAELIKKSSDFFFFPPY